MSRRSYAKLTSKEEQRVVALRTEGLTFDVIAARMGCSKGTVWNALRVHGLASAPSSTSNRAEDGVETCTGAIRKKGTAVSTQSAPIMHVLSQDGQPYGSERRCCNYCGIMLWGPLAPSYVDNWPDWRARPDRCALSALERKAGP